jgi:GNAT superfamily N-acetyltransferase
VQLVASREPDFMEGITFRKARIDDSSAIARLVTQLGYPTTPLEMEERLKPLLSHPEDTTIVAEASGQVVGLVGAYLGHALEFDSTYGLLTGLVVDERWRGRGLGRTLMDHIERWLREQGASRVTLTSGKHRIAAHRFYEAIGYDATGVRFGKPL